MNNTFAIAKNVEESTRVSRHRNVKATPKQCYSNAVRVIEHVPGYEDAWYVEGFAVFQDGLVIEHGWVESSGEVIDPTLPNDRMDYFPGLRFRGQAGIAKALKLPKHFKTDSDLPFFYRFGWGGHGSPEFRKAREDAWAYVS